MHIETQIQLCNRTFKKMETPDVYTRYKPSGNWLTTTISV